MLFHFKYCQVFVAHSLFYYFWKFCNPIIKVYFWEFDIIAEVTGCVQPVSSSIFCV